MHQKRWGIMMHNKDEDNEIIDIDPASEYEQGDPE